jgi:spermidine/putrescine transport system permease protein
VTGGLLARLAWGGFMLAVLGFLLMPLGLVILFSFNAGALTSLPISGLTFDWYARLFANRSFLPALWNSLIVGAAVGLMAVLFGTLAALALVRLRPSRATALIDALSAPMMMPALVIAIALLVFFVRFLGARMGLTTVILGQLVVIQPFVIALLYARLSAFDWRLVDAARDLGAGPLRAFLDVTLPVIRPSLIGAGLIALSLSLDDFVISFFMIGSGNTLPTLVWGLVRTSLDPTINAIATLLLALSIGSTILALRLSRYRG